LQKVELPQAIDRPSTQNSLENYVFVNNWETFKSGVLHLYVTLRVFKALLKSQSFKNNLDLNCCNSVDGLKQC
jgi:hypothetical protein